MPIRCVRTLARKAFESDGGHAAAKKGLRVGICLILLALDELEPALRPTLELCLPLDGGGWGGHIGSIAEALFEFPKAKIPFASVSGSWYLLLV
jgi:hypothetical protein